jgi:hypothetical protein
MIRGRRSATRPLDPHDRARLALRGRQAGRINL